jgi:hypothetical protein
VGGIGEIGEMEMGDGRWEMGDGRWGRGRGREGYMLCCMPALPPITEEQREEMERAA